MTEFRFSDRFEDLELGEQGNLLSEIKKNKDLSNISVVDLVSSNPTKLGLLFPMDVYSHNVNQSNISEYDPQPLGLDSARGAISNFYHSIGYDIEIADLLLTASTSEGFSLLLKLLTNPGDEILIPSPGYPLFTYLSIFENVSPVEYSLVEEKTGQWSYNLDQVIERVTSKTKALVIVSPSNPTGSFLNSQEWQLWLDWSEKTNIPILLDEVFAPYFHSTIKHNHPLTNKAPLFILNGISKHLALPQLKLGWIHVQGTEIFKKAAMARLELLSDTYLSVNSPVQIALSNLLIWSDMIQTLIKNRIRRNLGIAANLNLNQERIKFHHGQAGWYGWIEIVDSGFETDEFIAEQLLFEKNIYTHPGSWYGFPENKKILVISLIVSEDQFLAGVEGLLSFLK